MAVRQALVLAGGKGTRLGEATRSVPKPLVQIAPDRVFCDYLIENIARQGFDDIVLLAGHLGHLVVERYHNKTIYGSSVRVLVEPEPRGTGGALLDAAPLLTDHFLMVNGDTLFDINLRAFAQDALRLQQPCVLALRYVDDAGRYGSVALDKSRIEGFREKDPHATGRALVNAGSYLASQDLAGMIKSLPCSIEGDVFPKLAQAGKLGGLERDGYFLDIGLPETLGEARVSVPRRLQRPAVFLDRDGVLNEDTGYVHKAAGCQWVAGAKRAVQRINDLGYQAIVVTNQAGVAHGLYSEDDVHSFHRWMTQELAAEGAYVDAYYHCPYHPEAKVAAYRADHPHRKPAPGMILAAIADRSIDTSRSFLIGDRQSDLEAARQAGIPGYLFSGGSLPDFLEACLAAEQKGGK